jgi:hypothetical protein
MQGLRVMGVKGEGAGDGGQGVPVGCATVDGLGDAGAVLEFVVGD